MASKVFWPLIHLTISFEVTWKTLRAKRSQLTSMTYKIEFYKRLNPKESIFNTVSNFYTQLEQYRTTQNQQLQYLLH